MPWNPNSFIGLYQEGGLSGRNYYANLSPEERDAGTRPCVHDANPPFHYTPWTAWCNAMHNWDITQLLDLSTATSGLPASLSVAERAAQPYPPVYAQVFVHAFITTTGAPALCPPADSSTACFENANSLLRFYVAADFDAAVFPWGSQGEFSEQDRFLLFGNTGDDESDSGILSGYLTRPPDGDSYTGDPTNDASATLIPFDQFMASPGISVRARVAPSELLIPYGVRTYKWDGQNDNHVIVRLFFPFVFGGGGGEGLSNFLGGA